jgi:hypothetical protein
MMANDMNESSPGRFWVRTNLVATAMFVVLMAVAVPFRDRTSVQIAVAVVSMVLFAIGTAACLWAYISALDRSRVDELGVANLFLLTGPTAPRQVKWTMSCALGVQVVVSLVGASVGAAGLSGRQVNALAFGILVPMLGLGMNAMWAVRHGTFGPRVDPAVQPSNRKIG